ncbi:MAG: hypothetical protein GWO24_27635, partial [Akkermansiaceae bacterium]|nr:hypothetical protein [Akkermansiaceae bacterium]
MKMISPLLTVAITALSFVVVAPGADARPPGKSHGLPSLKDRTEKSQRVSTTAMPKTIGLMAAGDTKLRFKRKIG